MGGFILKKNLKVFLILCMFSLFVIFSGACDKSSDPLFQQSQFNDFINDIFIEEVQQDTISLNYTLAHPENFGIEGSQVTLGEFSIDKMNEDLKDVEQYLKELKKFDYDILTSDQQLTYDILMYSLEQELEVGNYLYYLEALGPTTGLQAQLPIILAEYNFYDKYDIETYLELLPCVYDYIQDVAEFEKLKSKEGLFMSDSIADEIIQQCSSFIENPDQNFLIEYFNEKIDNYPDLSKEEVDKYKKENREKVLDYIIPSYELLIETLEELKGTGKYNGGLYDYPQGKAYYEYLVKSKTGSDKDMDQVIDMLEKAVGDCILDVTKLSLTDPLLYDKIDSFDSFPLTDPDEILENLRIEITKDFPDLIEVDCDIKYVHESLSDYLSPAMYLVPALDSYHDNSIYINGDDIETLSYIYTTVAHESYPGHLYQNVYFKSLEPAYIRNILDFNGYDEGWATYVELYSYQMSGIDPQLATLLEINNKLILSMYARTDIGIHYEGWTKDKAIAYINQFYEDPESSEEIYDTLLEEPAVYLPYAVGYLEICELKDKTESIQGDSFNLKDFHKFLLDIGPAPFKIINDRMDIWLNNDTEDFIKK